MNAAMSQGGDELTRRRSNVCLINHAREVRLDAEEVDLSAECMPRKKDAHCFTESSSVTDPEVIKGRWSKEEDETLIQMVNTHGTNDWPTVACAIPGRSDKQCQRRWKYNLDPSVNKEAWSEQEDVTLIRAHQIYGNKWCQVAKFLPGRTNHAIKHYWKGPMKRKLDSYLASGLLEKFPGLPENLSIPENSNYGTRKDSQVSSKRNKLSSASPTSSKSKQLLKEQGENKVVLEGKSSNFIRAKGLDANLVKSSHKVDGQMARSRPPVRPDKRLARLSSPVELKLSIATGSSPRSQREKQMNSASDCHTSNSSPSNSCQDILPDVSPDCVDAGLSSPCSSQPNDVCSSEICCTSGPRTLETVSDLLDMPYCENLLIIPPGSPHDGHSMSGM